MSTPTPQSVTAPGAESRLCWRSQALWALVSLPQARGGCGAADRSDLCPNTPQSPTPGPQRDEDPAPGRPEPHLMTGARAQRPNSALPALLWKPNRPSPETAHPGQGKVGAHPMGRANLSPGAP